MSDYELMQWAGLGAGFLAFVVIVVAIVRWSRRQDAIWPECAKSFGLVFKEEAVGGGFSNRHQRQKSMEGVARGVPIRVLATSERIGNTTRTGTRVFGRAQFPVPHQFSFRIERGGNRAAPYHVVPTGDPNFDRWVVLKSDAPAAVRALVDPAVRAALLQLHVNEISVSYDRGEICLSFAGAHSSRQELDGAIFVVIAAANARL